MPIDPFLFRKNRYETPASWGATGIAAINGSVSQPVGESGSWRTWNQRIGSWASEGLAFPLLLSGRNRTPALSGGIPRPGSLI